MLNSNHFAIYNHFIRVDKLPVYNGDCRIDWPDGSSYIGQFINNNIEGYGIYTFTDQAKYVGFWKNNIKHGIGTLYYPNGSKLQGEFRYDAPNGKGILYTVNDNESYLYVGNFINGSKYGFGKLYEIDSTSHELEYKLIYIGEFKKDRFSGKGIYYHSNGNIFYEGNWVDNLPFGNGLLYDINGSLKEVGYYIKGELQTKYEMEHANKIKRKLRNNIFFDFNYIE